MKPLTLFLLVCVMLLASCGTQPTSVSTISSAPTQAPEVPAQTAIPAQSTTASTPGLATPIMATGISTAAPITGVSPTPSSQASAEFFILGRQAASALNPQMYPYVFLYDPHLWNTGNSTVCQGCKAFLQFDRQQSPKCSFRVNPAMEFDGTPQDDKTLGNRVWSLSLGDGGKSILYYANWGYGGSLNIVASGVDDSQCQADIEKILSETYYTWEIYAGPVPSDYQPAQQPGLPSDYSCASLPSRLHIGAAAHVVVDSIWIRSEPRRSEDTKVLLIYPGSPIQITVNNGPVCVDGMTFWNIIYTGTGLQSGWLAEADSKEYYLEPVAP